MVMLMAGPAVNMASILVIRKSMGGRFTAVYISTIVVFSILFGLLVNALGVGSDLANVSAGTLTVTGTATESEIRRAVEQAGFEMH